MIAAQAIIDDMLDTDEGKHSDAAKRDFFAEMKSISALILHASMPKDLNVSFEPVAAAFRSHVRLRQQFRRERAGLKNRSRRIRPLGNAPTSVALMAGVATTALKIVRAPSSEAACSELKVLGRRCFKQVSENNRWRMIDRCGLSPRLRVLLEKAVGVDVYFDRRAGARSVSSTTGVVTSHRYEARHVPQLFPMRDYEKNFLSFFNGAAENFARRFCSLAAVKLLGFTWPKSAAALELPTSATGYANAMVAKLGRDGNYEQFMEVLRDWAASLSESNRKVDYQMRRDALRSTTVFLRSTWRRMCAEGGIDEGRNETRNRFAAAWAWADATEGDWLLAPGLNGVGGDRRQRYLRTIDVLGPAMKAALRLEMNARIEQHQSKLAKRKGAIIQMTTSSTSSSSSSTSS
ncbi:hypothetical protein WKW77_24445 [Variovorax ureilyticus]|uniref:Uncharacterized protein n=1 Tax=Variovorax ureilyticus TaxID=1836198 RepID=A0ABU8VKX8_9BURK